ncbi:30S ribosomal protein S5 [Mycoplasma procyoni]|uniref:30S ribosomal protein S5 n=1 Tax=Mycoplasma procyoni TaxID=568784 RepID=UPI00197B25AF|nr:30S ribosomal protein S5 [Mycoplasma procyoni]MBN3534980.1 30S ribosomal protein S5 [Mycoplasma procyoni]
MENQEIKKDHKKAAPTQTVTADKKAEAKPRPERKNSSERRAPRQKFAKKQRDFSAEKQFEEKVIDIARVTTVVKGGRRFSFSAYVVVGNKKGKVGFGHGKANEVQDAIKKAVKDAQNNLIYVPIVDEAQTVPHEVKQKFLASRVMLKPAPKGKGIIASGTVRAVVELAGYQNIYTKTYGSRTKANIVRATMDALQNLRTVEKIAELRDIKVEDLLNK